MNRFQFRALRLKSLFVFFLIFALQGDLLARGARGGGDEVEAGADSRDKGRPAAEGFPRVEARRGIPSDRETGRAPKATGVRISKGGSKAPAVTNRIGKPL